MRALALACCFVCLPALADNRWEVIHQDQARVVEIDRSSVRAHPDGTVSATGRLIYGTALAESRGFAMLVAFNRYDCAARTFSIIKRSYLDAEGRPADVEVTRARSAMPVGPGSLDDRLLLAACAQVADGLPDGAELRRAADGDRIVPPISIAPKLVEKPAIEPRAVPAAAAPPAAAKTGTETAPEPARTPESARTSGADRPTAARSAPAASGGAQTPAANEASRAAARRIAERLAETLSVPGPNGQATARPSTESARTIDVRVPKRPPAQAEARPVRRPAPAPAYAAAAHADPAHWSYAGPDGPEHWADLDPSWSACARGERQSPIDIRDGIKVALEPIAFDYRPGGWTILDNGHTVQVMPASGNAIQVGGRRYELVQIHFHRPGEERVDGRTYAMSVHLVHKSADGRVAVVAVLVEPGESSPAVDALWAYLPLERNDPVVPGVAFDPAGLLPALREYWTYMGSLTTPPCSEGVLWLVLKTPRPWSADQIAVFGRLYPMNARPVQPNAGRLVKESR